MLYSNAFACPGFVHHRYELCDWAGRGLEANDTSVQSRDEQKIAYVDPVVVIVDDDGDI